MRMNCFILAGAALAVLAGVLATARVYAQRLKPRSGLVQKNRANNVTRYQQKYAPPPFQMVRVSVIGNNPVFPVSVDSGLTLDQTTQALYQQMATTLTGYATVPNDRTNYFSALNNNADFQFGWWAGTIENVQTINGGHVVTVGVYPVFTNRATVLVPNDYTEQYLVGNNGSITYQGSADPNGYAGQMPGNVDF